MAQRKLRAFVKNTGSVAHEFVVGATVGAPGGGEGCGLYVTSPYRDLTPVKVYIEPGNTREILWNFDDSFLTSSTGWAVVKVWKDVAGGTCLAGRYAEFTVKKIVKAEIVSLTVS